MKFSQLFVKTLKDVPKDETAKSAELLLRAGFVRKEMAGVYSYLPFGLRMLRKIADVVRSEMDAIGGVELQMTTLQDSEVWKKTGRWSDEAVDNWFKTKLKNETELGLGFTHEEPLTETVRAFSSSHRDFPRLAYQIQTKFRNELRAKSGVMRGREFLMKDLYSFCKDKQEQVEIYERVKQAYIRIFARLGIGDITYLTFASGGSFSRYSHEFQTLTEAGEDLIYIDEEKKIAVNREVLEDDVLKELGLERSKLVEKKAVEVGNIFTLGTKFSEPIGLIYLNEAGERVPVEMGSYGIGISRLMGVLAEVFHDEKGLSLRKPFAPFCVYLASLIKDEALMSRAEEVYQTLVSSGIEVLFDDRLSVRAGEKFADADLIGLPWRAVVSDKSLAAGGVEISARDGSFVPKIMSLSEMIDFLKTK